MIALLGIFFHFLSFPCLFFSFLIRFSFSFNLFCISFSVGCGEKSGKKWTLNFEGHIYFVFWIRETKDLHWNAVRVFVSWKSKYHRSWDSRFSFCLFFWFFSWPYFSAALKEGNRTKKRKCGGWINVLVEALIIFILENQDNSLWDLVSLLEGNAAVLPFIFGNWQNNSGISWYMLHQVIHFSIAILFKWALFCSNCLTSYNKCSQLESSHFFL